MMIRDYIIAMQKFMRQAIKEPYSHSFMIDNDKYIVKINGFTVEFDLILIVNMSAVMSPYLAGKQILESWKEQYIASIVDVNMIKLMEI